MLKSKCLPVTEINAAAKYELSFERRLVEILKEKHFPFHLHTINEHRPKRITASDRWLIGGVCIVRFEMISHGGNPVFSSDPYNVSIER